MDSLGELEEVMTPIDDEATQSLFENILQRDLWLDWVSNELLDPHITYSLYLLVTTADERDNALQVQVQIIVKVQRPF